MPLLTFTSDFGTTDHMVGAIKGELFKLNEGFTVVDITHDIIPHNAMQAAYVCKTIFRSFPPETCHLVLVNAFENNADHLLLVRHQQQLVGIPDNGLITMILNGLPEEVVAIPLPKEKKTVTLFTRILVEAFSAVMSGVALPKIGDSEVRIVEKILMQPFIGPNYLEGQILMIDRFLNVIVNITLKDFETARQGRRFKIVLLRNEMIERISNHYAEVSDGEKLAFFNEAGFLEIAVNKGHAAPLFGLGEFPGMGGGYERRQYYQTVKVFFE
jgi:S-adenosyl-L-methionine hydrolase (adenosine-forming)